MKNKQFIKDSLQWNLLSDSNSLILFLSSFFMAMGAHILTPVIPEIISHFNITEVKAGLIMSLFTLPTIFLSPIVGSLADRYGRKIFLTWGMLLFGISGVIPLFLSSNFNLALVARTIQGFGFAAVMPLTITVLGDLHKGNTEVAAQGIRTFFISAGGFLFPIIGGAIAIFGWNYPFIFYLSTIPFSIYMWRNLPEAEKITNNNKSFTLKIFLEELKVIKDSFILMVLFSSLIRFFLSIGLRVYVPILLVNKFSVNLAFAGFVLGSMQFTKSFTSLQLGNITRHLGMLNSLIIGFFAYGVGTFFLPFSSSIILIFVIMIIFGIGDGILSPLQKSLLTQNVSAENRAAIVSINASLQGIGRTISPVVVGIIMVNHGLNWAFWVMTIITFIPILFFKFNKNKYSNNKIRNKQ